MVQSLKQLRRRITTVRSTQKITRAMKLVATTKLRRAQAAIEAARPYARRMSRILEHVTASDHVRSGGVRLLAGTGRERVFLLLVVTTDRGLCGALNSNMVRFVKEQIARAEKAQREVKILCVGRKAYRMLRREHTDKIIDVIDWSGARLLGLEHARVLAQRLLALYDSGAFDVCCQYYSRYRTALTQSPSAQQIIPVRFARVHDGTTTGAGRTNGAALPYEFEPSEAELLETLSREYIVAQLFRAILEHGASEQGARMTAMDRATRNARELTDKLTLAYNRQRQALITKEINEIVSGVEAMR